MASKVGIIGGGNVGSALNRGIQRAGYASSVSDRNNVAEVASNADVVILAVPIKALDDVVKKLGASISGKIVIDVTNTLTPEMAFDAKTTSGAEELQNKIPSSKVVNCFNTVFAQHMDTGKLNGQLLTAFAASDDEDAKEEVLKLAKDIGFDAMNGGPLSNAKHLESLGFFNIQLGYVLGNGVNAGYRYVHQSH